jgi:hypothetical protein
VGLPVDPEVASVVVRERLAELAFEGRRLAEHPSAPVQLINAVANLGRYAKA